MKKAKHSKVIAKTIVFILLGALLVQQPISVLATESTEDKATETASEDSLSENTISENDISQEFLSQYIAEIKFFSETEGYYAFEEKVPLDELKGEFPETLSVRLEGTDEFTTLPVTWECEVDYENTEEDSYLFYPKWNELLFMISEEAAEDIEVPYILVEIVPEGEEWKMISDLEQAREDLKALVQEKSVLASVYLSDAYEVKEEASEDSQTVQTVPSGQSVLIQDVALGDDGGVWYQVLFYANEQEYTGYVERYYLITADMAFREWEEKYINPGMAMMAYVSDRSPDIEQFPASYRNALYNLKEIHPNWSFVKMDTKLDWNTVIAKENVGDKNVVHKSSPDSWKNGAAVQGWCPASESILKYYIDPRNFLSDPYIFQFEQLTYNPEYHTSSAIQGMVKNSFMASTIPGDNMTYAEAFEQIGKELGVSPFHLASRVLQEQGTRGTSALISGAFAGYEGYYNYYNISASGGTDLLVIVNGLKKAKAEGWNTRYKSLYGGARFIGKEYILMGQDTLYLQKFNVSNGAYNNFTHQYMQNVGAPSSESVSIRRAYSSAGALEQTFIFKIPVYTNMPATACVKPNTAESVTLNRTSIDSLAVGQTQTLIPYVNGSLVDSVSVLSFMSSDTSVATVTSDGKITAVFPGTATITCSNGTSSATCKVTVVKADPAVAVPAPLPVIYKEAMSLSDIELPSGWVWQNKDTGLSAGTASYTAVYTPADTQRYNTITKEVSLTVTKAIPVYQAPEGLQADYGACLGTVRLPAGFVWEQDASLKIEKTGEGIYYAAYNPDGNNYHTIDHIPVRIKIIGGPAPDEGDDDFEVPPTSSGSTSGDYFGDGTGGSGTGSHGGSTSTPSASTSTSSSSTSTSSTSTGTTSSTSTGTTSSASTSTSSTSTGTTSSTSTGTTSSNSTGTSSSSTSTSSTSTGTTSNSSTSTSSSSTSTSSTSTGTTSNSSTSTSSSSTSTSSTSTGTTSSASTGTSSTSTGTTSNSSTSTSSSSTSTSSSSTSTSSTSTGTTSNSSTSTPSTSTGTTSSTSTSTSSSTSTGTSRPGTSVHSVPAQNPDNQSSAGQSGGDTGNQSNETGGSDAGSQSGSTNAGSAGNQDGSTDAGSAGNQSGSTNADSTGNQSGSTNAGSTGNQSGSTNAGSAGSQNGSTNAGSAGNQNSNTNASSAGNQDDNTNASDTGNQSGSTGGIDGQNSEASQEPVYAKPSVTIDMQDTTVLSGEEIQLMKDQKLDLVLNIGNQMKWFIDADTVRSEIASAVDMGVQIVNGMISEELITELAGTNEYYELSLAHEGDFGFDPVLQILFSPEDAGSYANLFYYDPDAQELEFICSSVIDENGAASFTFTHASEYLIIITDQPMSNDIQIEESSGGVLKWVIGAIVILLIGAAVVTGIFLYRKREEEEEEEEEEEDEEGGEDEEEEQETEEYEGHDDSDESNDEFEEYSDSDDEYDGFVEADDSGDEYDDFDDSDDSDDEYDDFDDSNDSGDEYDDFDEADDSDDEYDGFVEADDSDEEEEWIEDEEWEEEEWINDEEWEKLNQK